MNIETIIIAYLHNRLIDQLNTQEKARAAFHRCRTFRLHLETIPHPTTEYVSNTISMLLDIEETLTEILRLMRQSGVHEFLIISSDSQILFPSAVCHETKTASSAYSGFDTTIH